MRKVRERFAPIAHCKQVSKVSEKKLQIFLPRKDERAKKLRRIRSPENVGRFSHLIVGGDGMNCKAGEHNRSLEKGRRVVIL
jgi:hypothetical protein